MARYIRLSCGDGPHFCNVSCCTPIVVEALLLAAEHDNIMDMAALR